MLCVGTEQVPTGVEIGVASMAREEHAIISCDVTDATPVHTASLVPAPPAKARRVEYDIHLHNMTQVPRLAIQHIIQMLDCVHRQ